MSHTGAVSNQHGSNQQNIYRRDGSGESELGTSCSSKKAEHTFMDAFRERLSFRTRRESQNASSCENEMLDEDLGHPPTPNDAPPGTIVGSLQSESLLSASFRSRSRSDATVPPLTCRQSMGTIVLFPNRKSKSRKNRVRSERHSVCVTDLSEFENTNVSLQTNHLFVDTKLANDSVKDKKWYGPVSVPDMKSQSNQPSPFQSSDSGNNTYEKRHSPSVSRSDRGFVSSQNVESEPTSPFSNCAILIKETD